MDFLHLYTVDAFTSRPFGGNPAGIVKGAEVLTSREMQLLAGEINLSETAYVFPPRKEGHLALRFFTPTTEVDICGHATLAALWVLALEGSLVGPHVQVETRAGLLEAQIQYGGAKPQPRHLRRILLGFPPPVRLRSLRKEEEEELERALGLRPAKDDLDPFGIGGDEAQGNIGVAAGAPGPAPCAVYDIGLNVLVVPVRDQASLYDIRPRFEELDRLSRRLAVSVIYAFALPGSRPSAAAEARMFAPRLGIREEAATGTAAACLARYLLDQGFLGPAGSPAAFPLPHLLGDTDANGVPHLRLIRPGEGEEEAAQRPRLSFSIQQGEGLRRPSTIEVEVEFSDEGDPRIWVGGACRPVIQGRYLR
ncbi:MAG: PhzF family phenazine biosynthesis protein [Bacillota bacterium]|nr:PhzF family phenazine biosynthesis protein [Bacillota bacterium]